MSDQNNIIVGDHVRVRYGSHAAFGASNGRGQVAERPQILATPPAEVIKSDGYLLCAECKH